MSWRTVQVRERLHRISQGQYCDLRPLAERSPSPEPTYNVCGTRNNTRALRHRETLQTRQDCIVKELLATCHGFRPPEDWRPKQKTRQLSLPESELVGHDALQRMLGLRGRARQDIEHRTGATISLQCAACAAAPNSSHSGCTPLINTGDRASTVAAQRRFAHAARLLTLVRKRWDPAAVQGRHHCVKHPPGCRSNLLKGGERPGLRHHHGRHTGSHRCRSGAPQSPACTGGGTVTARGLEEWRAAPGAAARKVAHRLRVFAQAHAAK